MTNQEKQARLAQYRPALRELEGLEGEVQAWRTRAGGLCGGEGQGLEDAVAQIAALERELAEQIAAVLALRNRIQLAIDGVEELRLRRLLELRYIQGMGWKQVAGELGYEVRWVFRLHRRALAGLTMEGH